MTMRSALARAAAVPARGYVRHAPTQAFKPVLVRRLLEPALRRHPRAFTARTVDGFQLGGTTNDMIQRYVYVFGVWEPHLTAWMRPRLTSGRSLIDVGANVGYFSLLGSTLVGPSGRVVAIEALPSTFTQLRDNLARNGASNVRALNVAAAATAGELTLYGGEAHNSGTTTSIPTAGLAELTTVEAAPLADLLTPREVATARIVKIDVEGAELGVLQGLAPVLDRMPGDVELVVEISPDDLERGGHAAEEPLELLAGHGFVPYRIRNDYRPVSYIDEGAVEPPRRFTGPLTERLDLVFSRTDAPTLP